MAARLIEPTEQIDVTFVPMLVVGPPGCGKTSITQTAEEPLTLDLDTGIHRAFNRKRAMRFDRWTDLQDEQRKGTFSGYKTIVVDTLGRLLDLMTPKVKELSDKNCSPAGLSQQGWGVLGRMFQDFVKSLRDGGHDLVLLAHEVEGKNARENPIIKPDIPGRMAWSEIHKWCDLIGHVTYRDGKKLLDFNPGEVATFCKNAAGWPPIVVPPLEQRPTFLADLIADAKAKLGKTAATAAAMARLTAEWEPAVSRVEAAAGLTAMIAQPEMAALDPAAKRHVWHVITHHADKKGWTFDKATKTFRDAAQSANGHAAARAAADAKAPATDEWKPKNGKELVAWVTDTDKAFVADKACKSGEFVGEAIAAVKAAGLGADLAALDGTGLHVAWNLAKKTADDLKASAPVGGAA